ncbi:histidine triad nucleotide-binding protein [Bifidobacterium castoris]|uniref:Histidine triad nucleotide-binding protein n=1 Tax=Bifidobacterium castoris TaxID=2306972 RepID=A0A430FAU2_9BIFI|nr:histidine triad nucleotide-binding protein [Bifidobacterium castoris]RSX49945.1 histidine triad nucleotide-binding protein [Bifidobacterium castoris]
MSEPDCLFCKIVNCDIPSEKVYEDASVYAFRDINPKAKVHALVVPREHYRDVDELARADAQLLAHIVEVAQRVADQEYDGSYRLVFNTGASAGQTVFHVHAHVLTGEPLDE